MEDRTDRLGSAHMTFHICLTPDSASPRGCCVFSVSNHSVSLGVLLGQCSSMDGTGASVVEPFHGILPKDTWTVTFPLGWITLSNVKPTASTTCWCSRKDQASQPTFFAANRSTLAQFPVGCFLFFPLFFLGGFPFKVNQPKKTDADAFFPMEIHWTSTPGLTPPAAL